MKNTLKKIHKLISSKRFIILTTYICLVLFTIVSTITFSNFTSRNEDSVANMKVADMNYNLVINGNQTTIIYASNNNETIANIIINSLNNVNSKYELIYNVCSNEECTSLIETPNDLIVEYSSRTIDEVTGIIEVSEFKQLRIAITNNTSTGYYLKFGINAGYIHNTLDLENLITTEYNEEDVTIAAIIDGEISTTFPTEKSNYEATVTCLKNGGATSAVGTANWNGSKWVVNITGVDTGQVICNVNFFVSFKNIILAQGGGASAIEAKGTPDFSVINGTSGLYAAEDEYGTSYYYRGLKTELNNNVIWGGFQWKIIRINGNGSIRLIYNGTEAQFNTNSIVNDIGANTQITTSAWNLTNRDDAKYVGYMYGGANGVASTVRHGSTSIAATYNETNSNAKAVLDDWYIANIEDELFEVDVVDNLFCNDRQLQSEVGGGGTGPGYGNAGVITYYAAYYRLNTTRNPSLRCGLKNDRFTSNDNVIGNGALIYPVGLITADEAAMAGLLYGTTTNNNNNYLYTNKSSWSMSPIIKTNNGYACVAGIYNMGNVYYKCVYDQSDLRPVMNIIGNIAVTGTGSATDPFIPISS